MSAGQDLVGQTVARTLPAVIPKIFRARDWLWGVLAFFAAFPLAAVIYFINQTMPQQPERAVELVAILLGLVVVLPPAGYILLHREGVRLSSLALIVLIGISIALVAIYLYWVSSYVTFPADFVIWSESDFVNDILKFRLGYPIYTAQANNESFTYSPGSQLLTYFLASLLGHATSIPAYRVIQLGYTAGAAFFALLCVRQLIALCRPLQRAVDLRLMSAFALPLLFLIASNSLTNPFVSDLHDDALAQLVTLGAYYLLLRYVATHDRRLLVLMVLVPALGFLVKQSLVIWAAFYWLQLVLFDRPISLKRAAGLALASILAIAAIVVSCYLLWGSPFIYWVITVLSSHGVLPLRSFEHLLQVWIYFVIGLLGGIVLLRGKNFRLLLGLWVIWLALISSETYTSGIAYMINHIGPGSLIAGVWFVAAITRAWPIIFPSRSGRAPFENWLRTALAVLALGLILSGLNVVRIPLSPLPQDAYRYVNDIASQFAGQSSAGILLDVGSWVYFSDGVIMKDRAPSIGERGYSGTGDFTGIIQRLQQKQYSKILVRSFHDPNFWYDSSQWARTSGIRQAMLENYREVGTIPGVQLESYQADLGYLFGSISILVPKGE